MGNYQSLNVLSQNQRNDFMSDDAVTEVSRMLKNSGANRSQRRRLEKSLGRMETILEHAQKHVDRSAYREYQNAVDMNFTHFFAILALTMEEDYKWKEDETHNQISSILERVGKKIDKYAKDGYETEDLIKLVEERFGILLIPEAH